MPSRSKSGEKLRSLAFEVEMLGTRGALSAEHRKSRMRPWQSVVRGSHAFQKAGEEQNVRALGTVLVSLLVTSHNSEKLSSWNKAIPIKPLCWLSWLSGGIHSRRALSRPSLHTKPQTHGRTQTSENDALFRLFSIKHSILSWQRPLQRTALVLREIFE